MKKLFRKMKGKNTVADELNRNSIQGRPNVENLNNTQGRPKDSALTAPTLDLVNRYLEPAPVQNVPQKSATSGSGRLRITAAAPLHELAEILAMPASIAGVDGRDLIQVQPPAEICPVCCNFDASHAPKDGDRSQGTKSWAHTEYNIPEGTPVGKISIEKSDDLLNRANGGCFYCLMVQIALGVVHPGWETEKTFLDIFLASNLPVVVRLHFGGISKVSMGREAMLELGVDLPEGQNMEFTITIEDPIKKPIDVEIYRPRISPDQSTVGDVALSPLAGQIGFAEEVPVVSTDPKCFDFIKDKLANCMKEHRCGRDGHLPLLPDRVIWVEANNATRIQLLEPKNIRAKYLALSYCWGPVNSNIFLTDQSTFDARKIGIDYRELPPLFQNVVDCARSLGIEYIWIDRLCIIQGDSEDFKIQAPKMGNIYGNSTLTLAASSASSENDRIFVERDSKWQSFILDMKIGGIGALQLRTRRRTHPLGTENKGGDYGKVSTRAWIWQERLLAARSVFFTPSALKFECKCHSVWEGFDHGVVGHSWSNQLDNISHQSWTTLVEEYTSRDITRPSDRLPAMEAVMERISKSTGWSPLWGLWANALVESLGWESKELDAVERRQSRMNPGYYAPTWSWASIDGPIIYVSAQPDSAFEAFDPMTFALECRRLDAALGVITFAGHVIPCRLIVTIEPREQDPGSSAEQARFSYKYTAKFVDNLVESTLKPDVALMPWTGNINGQFVSTVIRVPYGQANPQQSWTAECYCLLIGRRKMRSLVLYLGRSLRVPGAWERIGMVDGISPALFSTSQRQIISIV